MSETIRLPRSTAIQLMQQAQRAPEHEVCGLIAFGESGWRVAPVTNVAAEPAHAFEMDPAGLVAAQRKLREMGMTLWGVYHSHPKAAAVPSSTDLADNGYPELVQIIISLDVRGVLQLRAWRTQEEAGVEGVRELRLEVHDD